MLCGCVTTAQRSSPAPTKADLSWPQRLHELLRLHHYDFDGRVAASNGKDGFSAGLRWQQNDDQTVVDLSAPLGFGAAHIQRTDSLLRVTTNKGVSLDSAAAEDELRATLGFDAPLSSLRFWVIGASDPASVAQETLDSMQRLVHLQQGGWEVEYADYAWLQDEWLPQTVTVRRDMLRLKIVVHDWRLYRILGD